METTFPMIPVNMFEDSLQNSIFLFKDLLLLLHGLYVIYYRFQLRLKLIQHCSIIFSSSTDFSSD